MRVFLIHGMGRSRVSLLPLAARLRRAGHATSTFGYSVARAPLETIAARFVEHIEAVRKKDGDPKAPYAIIGHSLGNIITRLATPQLAPGLARFIMLAPPNQSPTLARKLSENILFRTLTGDAGQKLASPEFYAQLPRPKVPTCILAGDAGPRAKWLPFGGAEADGIVSVEETRLDPVPHRQVPALHTFIMNHPHVVTTIRHFLETGSRPQ